MIMSLCSIITYKQPDVAQNYNVFALLMTYFFSSKGEKLGPVPGYISKERLWDMLTKLQPALNVYPSNNSK